MKDRIKIWLLIAVLVVLTIGIIASTLWAAYHVVKDAYAFYLGGKYWYALVYLPVLVLWGKMLFELVIWMKPVFFYKPRLKQ